MKWLMVRWWIYHGCHRCCHIERSLVVHLWRVVVHSQSQANVMSIVVCLWRYVIMTTVWICVVCIWLLSLRVFFVLHATVLEPESKQMSYRCDLAANPKSLTIFWLDARSSSSFAPVPSASASTRKRWTGTLSRARASGTLNTVCASCGRFGLDLAIPLGLMAAPIQCLMIRLWLSLENGKFEYLMEVSVFLQCFQLKLMIFYNPGSPYDVNNLNYFLFLNQSWRSVKFKMKYSSHEKEIEILIENGVN